ncbi:MAG: hypothetical protein ACXACR_02460 [Candidatus Hodarchaeales archaeon]
MKLRTKSTTVLVLAALLLLPTIAIPVQAAPAQLISFGRLEAIFTGFFQVAMVIGIVIFVLGIFLIFFPGARKFIGSLLGG